MFFNLDGQRIEGAMGEILTETDKFLAELHAAGPYEVDRPLRRAMPANAAAPPILTEQGLLDPPRPP